jgi:pantetheine-phosphate adenylyltransferase
MALRITGGELGGRRLRAPRSGVRPSADRVRESLFALLGDLEGAAVLDLFAGTGALGIEALSRGAAALVCVERSRSTLAVLRENLATLGLDSVARVMAGDAAAAIARLGRAGERFDLVLMDPPYASEAGHEALAALVKAELLAPGAMVVLERSKSHPVAVVGGLRHLEDRFYGDTVITLFAVSAPDPDRPKPAEGRGAGRMVKAAGSPSRALIPASFDPVTNGHLDIIHRSESIFDELVVAVAVNVAKEGTFTPEERIGFLSGVLGGGPSGGPSVEVTSFSGLTTDFAREIGANVIVRGVRAMSDFEYEFEMALMNKHLYPDIETVFMMASPEYLYVSSSRLKELVQFGRDVSEFVPASVAQKLKERLKG